MTSSWPYNGCGTGQEVERGRFLRVRAADIAGNRDPVGTRILVPPPGQGFAGPESGLPTFAGARVEVGIVGQQPYEGLATPFECRIDGAAWARCPFAFRLPILHEGRHTLQARQRLAGTNIVMTTDELAMAVAPSTSATAIVGLQMALVIERSKALSRRAPRLRLALNRPAVLRVEIVRRGKRLVKVVAAGGGRTERREDPGPAPTQPRDRPLRARRHSPRVLGTGRGAAPAAGARPSAALTAAVRCD